MFRSILFTSLFFLSIPPYTFWVLFGRLFGVNAGYRAVLHWVTLVMWLARTICGLDFRVEGKEHLPEQASVVLMKHSSAYETMAQLNFLPQQVWVAKRELVWAPFFGWGLAVMQPIAINRSAGRSAVEQVVTQGKERLGRGLWVVIYPEGTRMAPGETRRYGISGTVLAEAAGAPIVPIAHNAGDFWPRRGWRKRPGTVVFRIGEPVYTAGRDPREVNETIQTWIEAQVAELRAQG